MNRQAQKESQPVDLLPSYRSILLAVDSSDHSNRGALEAVALASRQGARLTATHVYAAKLHDLRFRQMEGGLPEQFREEEELERQRDVHDDLITRGLSIITDSYLDQVANVAENDDIQVARRSLEGKNYRELVKEANNGSYDLLVLGGQGLGAVQSGRLGSVCQRVTRRTNIDTLVIKEPKRNINSGPIVVAVDGSTKSYGGLMTALSLARIWQVKVQVIAAFDPYYHYVAFNRIADVLSEEAGRVFKFSEQEKLHEEIIDSGLAKIYRGHLSVAEAIARDHGVEVETLLLDGKPHDIIARHLKTIDPSLLIMGTTGIHADAGLDIGSNSERLLNDTGCAVLLSQREYQPRTDRLASVTTSWTHEAEKRMERVPGFVRPMAKMAILRYAQEQGHTVITESIVEEATAQLMPAHAEKAMQEIVEAQDRGELKPGNAPSEPIRWSQEAKSLLLNIDDLSLRGNLSMRAEKRARVAGAIQVEADFVIKELGVEGKAPEASREEHSDDQETAQTTSPELEPETSNLHWHSAALARLMRVPEGFMRESSRGRIEAYAQTQGLAEINLAAAEAGLAKARDGMNDMLGSRMGGKAVHAENTDKAHFAFSAPDWTPEASNLLSHVPVGFCRNMTRKATETIAAKNQLRRIDSEFVQQIMSTFKSGSDTHDESMPWEDAARERIAKAPDMVRGMLVSEIEGWSKRNGLSTVNGDAVDAVKQVWAERGVFHLDPNDERSA
ncbi:MAG: universal stress protein [Gammaproteobacteria bacterium]|nr:universal stress protein [Gammaproteobacteria bacterium]